MPLNILRVAYIGIYLFSALTEWGFLKLRGIFPLDTFMKYG